MATTEQTYEADLPAARDRIDGRIPQSGWMEGEREKSINDALNNAWREGLTLDEWAGAAARLLGC